MNKEIKQILKNQIEILYNIATTYQEGTDSRGKIRDLILDTEDILNPKEVVPYEDSLKEECTHKSPGGLTCGKDATYLCPKHSEEFVKSSKGEKNE